MRARGGLPSSRRGRRLRACQIQFMYAERQSSPNTAADMGRCVVRLPSSLYPASRTTPTRAPERRIQPPDRDQTSRHRDCARRCRISRPQRARGNRIPREHGWKRLRTDVSCATGTGFDPTSATVVRGVFRWWCRCGRVGWSIGGRRWGGVCRSIRVGVGCSGRGGRVGRGCRRWWGLRLPTGCGGRGRC